MRVKDLDGGEYKWNPKNSPRSVHSKLHTRVKEILTSNFPLLPIMEEVSIKPYFHKTLYMDFYIPSYKICIEVHGAQHYIYNAFYHGSSAMFLRLKHNDVLKRQWCELNNIELLELKYDEHRSWEQCICGRLGEIS